MSTAKIYAILLKLKKRAKDMRAAQKPDRIVDERGRAQRGLVRVLNTPPKPHKPIRRKRRERCRCDGVFGIVASLAWLLTNPYSSSAARPTTQIIQHVVIVAQENRTPDNLFGAFRAQLPGADLATSGVTSTGKVVPLTPIRLGDTYGLDHSHASFVLMYDGGRMDGADLIPCNSTKPSGGCPPFPQFRYVKASDVMPYLKIAQLYSFANRMFQTNQGPSFPAHQFLLAGTSQLTPTSARFAAENMLNPKEGAGCAAPVDQRVAVIEPDGLERGYVFPCFEHQTLPDLLSRHSPPISWRYYAPDAINLSIWTAPNAIRHICRPSHGNCEGPSWTNGSIVMRPPRVLSDIADGHLRAVSWVIPDDRYSDHPGVNQNGSGPSWVAAIVNAIGRSPYWESTAVLITWDDWGGWYDHVAPPSPIGRPFGYYELGFRVPLLVVSPYTPAGYISPVQHDFGSILHFVEKVFGLGRIPPGNFADARADDLSDFFDFDAAPRPFEPIRAPLPPSSFINDRRPPLPPDDD
jgi:phospholipase C